MDKPVVDAAELTAAARGLIVALANDLAARAEADPRLHTFAHPLSTAALDTLQRGPLPPADIPGLRHLEPALDSAGGPASVVAAARRAARAFDWSQIFEGGGIEPGLAQGLMAAQAIGTYGVFGSETLAAGLFLLGPGITYPLHTHAADELYYCVSGTLTLQHGTDGAPFELAPGDFSITPSNRLHSLRTGDRPVLLGYVWTGEMPCLNWWWDRDAAGGWVRTAWAREGTGAWRPVRSEPVTPDLMAEAHP